MKLPKNWRGVVRANQSEFTHRNPWRKWPAYTTCFCGCGKKGKYCPAGKLMPAWITPKDYEIAQADFTDKLAYVEDLARKGEVYKDVEASNTLFRIFLVRDKTIENATYRENGNERGVGSDSQSDHDDRERRHGLAAAKLSGSDSGSDDGGAA